MERKFEFWFYFSAACAVVLIFSFLIGQAVKEQGDENKYRYEIVADGRKYNVLLYNVTPAASDSKFSLVLYMTSYFRHDIEIVVTNYSARRL